MLIGDQRRFKQVLINLVKNAVKFTAQGIVHLKSYYNTVLKCLVIHVSDTGVGIAKEDIPNLFNKFGKLQRTTEMNSDGIGLGLTIVKQIVEQGGGYVDVESDGVGKGSTFIFTLRMSSVEMGGNLRTPEVKSHAKGLLGLQSHSNDDYGDDGFGEGADVNFEPNSETSDQYNLDYKMPGMSNNVRKNSREKKQKSKQKNVTQIIGSGRPGFAFGAGGLGDDSLNPTIEPKS